MRNAAGHFRPIHTPMNTPALSAVVVAVMEDAEPEVQQPTRRARADSRKSFVAIVAVGLVVGSLGFLASRGELHPKTVWAPRPVNAKPWAPTPYEPIFPPPINPSALLDAQPPGLTFIVPPVLTAAPAPIAPSAAKVNTQKSKTKKHPT
jgi:hypothetical protein